MTTLQSVFAPFALRLSAGPLELRVIRDDDLPALAALAVDGIHDPAVMPFTTPWTDASPEVLPGQFAAYHWRTRAEFSPQRWSLDFVVRHEGEIVGTQGLHTVAYSTTRTGETGSWLGRRFQGQGIGTAMRQVLCAAMFDAFGAQEITSGAYTDNPASIAVSRKVGYRDNGSSRVERRGAVATLQRFTLRPDDFVRGRHPVRIDGADVVRSAIGLPAEGAQQVS